MQGVPWGGEGVYCTFTPPTHVVHPHAPPAVPAARRMDESRDQLRVQVSELLPALDGPGGALCGYIEAHTFLASVRAAAEGAEGGEGEVRSSTVFSRGRECGDEGDSAPFSPRSGRWPRGRRAARER